MSWSEALRPTKIKLEAIILLGMLIIFMIFLNHAGVLYPLNISINNLIEDSPDISCSSDTDCKLDIPSKLSECMPCDAYECKAYYAEGEEVVAINKNWVPRCVFSRPSLMCAQCRGSIEQQDYAAKCYENSCVKVRQDEAQ